MRITSISFQNFRNLENATLNFDTNLNLITGLNASGKTSILEALYYLTTGRSFRSRKVDNIITKDIDAKDFTLFGIIENEVGSSNHEKNRIGIKKTTDKNTHIRINGLNINAASSLAKLSPMLIIDPSSFDLFNGASKFRRQFMDWGVFHVEHSFSKLWNDYLFCLKQRNTLLRNAKINDLQFNIWEQKLSEIGTVVHLRRKKYADSFIQELISLCKIFSLDEELTISYVRGWDQKSELFDILKNSRHKDLVRKFTQYGPHRADIRIDAKGKPVVESLSRGQQKLLVLAMYIANIKCLMKIKNENTIVLIDDITAELDRNNLKEIFKCLESLNTQIILSSLDSEIVKENLFSGKCNMFHVEHGKINI